MVVVNPYDPPKTVGAVVATGFPWTRVAASSILLFIGFSFLLLVNGQVFTNRIWFLGFLAPSGLLWVRRWRESRRLTLSVLLLHAILMLAIIASLPGRFREQNRFNEKMEEFQTKSRGG
jgi:hypothetical protein